MIALYCFYFGEDGWARHGRGFADALNEIEEVALIPWDSRRGGASLMRSQEEMLARGERYDGRAVAIGLGPIERLPMLRGAWRIGFVVWETTIIPRVKLSPLVQMDELWTPSDWGRQILLDNGLAPHAVHVVPEGVETEGFRPSSAAPPHQFRFLAVGKLERRKGLDLLLSAWCAEFRPDEPVELVLHCSNPYLPSFDASQIVSALPAHAPIVISGKRPNETMPELYNSCDAFVLPTRAEGWGLPIMEAMACGLPVIVTDYSAPREYLDDSIAYPIPVKRPVPVDDMIFYGPGAFFGMWAEPDCAELRRILRYVTCNPGEAREKGRRARERVVARWTWRHSAARAQRLLSRVGMVVGV
jgi:glycosyltransferase involved in cell wall biosynthesis